MTLPVWETPEDYGGFDPVGHYVVIAQHRDSDTVARSNWQVAHAQLAEAAGIDAVPFHGYDSDDDNPPPVYEWRAGHWAVGWVEYLMVRPDAPQAVLDAAEEIVSAIADYPVLDDEHHSALEHTEMCDAWQAMSVRDRAELIKECGAEVSLFTARRDEVPSDDSGILEEWLR